MAESSDYNQRVKDYWGQSPPDPGHSFYLFPPLREYFLLLDLLIRVEETMTRLGETDSENAHIVARKP